MDEPSSAEDATAPPSGDTSTEKEEEPSSATSSSSSSSSSSTSSKNNSDNMVLAKSSSGAKKVGHTVMAGVGSMAKSAAQVAGKAGHAASKATHAASKATQNLSKETVGMVKSIAHVGGGKSAREGEKVETEAAAELSSPEEKQEPLPKSSVSGSSQKSNPPVESSTSQFTSSLLSEITTPTIDTEIVDHHHHHQRRQDDQDHQQQQQQQVVKPTVGSSSASSSSSPEDVAMMMMMMDDHMILWIVVLSIGVMQLVENISKIMANEFPISFVLAAMLVAFTAGLELDANAVTRKLKTTFLGIEDDEDDDALKKKKKKTTTPSNEAGEGITSKDLLHAGGDGGDDDKQEENTPKNPLTRFFQRGNRSIRRAMPPVTVLRRRPSQSVNKNRDSTGNNQHLKKHFDVNLLRRLQRFRTRHTQSDNLDEDEEEEPVLVGDGGDGDGGDDDVQVQSYLLGAADISKAHADVLSKKLPVKPMFELRGMDVFLADVSEAEMSNHPFLLKNGLREVPTFVLNMMTQWGNILIYMQMPDCVEDFGPSIVENENDSDQVKALKRFLNGSNEYRRARMKIMPEITEAPYAVRLLAPKGSEITLEKPNLLATTYRVHDVAGKLCPIMECTLDFMGNSTMRGMASIVKRYLSSISIDFALVIGTPDDQQEKEAECILGLCRMDHIDVTKYPTLPDRFETEGCSTETVDSIRASLLVKTAEMHSARLVATAAT